MARETVALQGVIPDTTLIHVPGQRTLASSHRQAGTSSFDFTVRDIDDVFTKTLHCTDVRIFLSRRGSGSPPHASLNISACVFEIETEYAVISLFDFVEIPGLRT